MTKEEAKKMLTNTKVYVNGKSKEIQEKLFKIGFSWIGDTLVDKTHFPFIYLNDDFYLRADKDMTFFKEHHFREVSAEDILNIKIDEKFVPKHGDIIFTTDINDNDWITIFNKIENGIIYSYADFDIEGNCFYGNNSEKNMLGDVSKTKNIRLASEEEKNKLFSALKEKGLVWNEKTKEVEKIKKEHKFKPFDRVLVRDDEEDRWRISLFAKKETDADFPYRCMGEVYSFCIPYEGNESLLGTSNSPEE